MVSPATSATRSDARVQHVDLQFGKDPAMHLQFASAARECLVMKRTTLPMFFPGHDGEPWSSLTGLSRQRDGRSRTAPATHGMFLRLAERLRSVRSPNKKGIRRRPKPHTLDLDRSWTSRKVADHAKVPLRTEQVVSFADVCRATPSLRAL